MRNTQLCFNQKHQQPLDLYILNAPHNYIFDVINDPPSTNQSVLFALPTTVTTATTSPLLRVPKIRRRLSPQHLRHRPRCPRWSGSEMVSLQSLTRGPSVRSFACRARMS